MHPALFLKNCILLWVPPLAISFTLWSRLGSAYQPDVFWADIPRSLTVVENSARTGVIAFSALLVAGFGTKLGRTGAAIYVLGLGFYTASYLAQILAPDGGWSQSLVGFTAPAWTAAIWITGIGLCAHHGVFGPTRVIRWAFSGLAVIFMAAHIGHTSLIWMRGI